MAVIYDNVLYHILNKNVVKLKLSTTPITFCEIKLERSNSSEFSLNCFCSVENTRSGAYIMCNCIQT